MFQIINSQTKQIVATRKTSKSAHRLLDKLDNAHGGYIHTIVERIERTEAEQALVKLMYFLSK